MSKVALSNDTYQEEYTKDFVSCWDDLIGWEGREEGEAGFFHRLLNAHGVEHVLDAASGTGFHSVVLARDGFSVTSCDGAEEMVLKTIENAKERDVALEGAKTVVWDKLKDEFPENHFEALICLGNAFTHIHDHEARRDALESMYHVLKPGGVIVLDHRNYDSILAEGYSSKHQYYYTGRGVDVHPVVMNRKLCKMQYTFPSGDVFSLQMYPIPQKYMSFLLEDAGFVDITRYGDFQRPYNFYDVDFIQQVAFKPIDPTYGIRPKHKAALAGQEDKKRHRKVRETREYYDGAAFEIYSEIWGENIHIGTFDLEGEGLQAAMERSNQRISDFVNVGKGGQVLDTGCGYGAFARYLSRRYGCRVLGTNIAERELERARTLTDTIGLDDLVSFEWADFHDLPYDEHSFDVYTSQEAFLHATDKNQVLAEAMRVLKPGGSLVFTDILIRPKAAEKDRKKIFERLGLTDMWDAPDYEKALKTLGFEDVQVNDWSENVAPTYDWVRTQLMERREEFDDRIGEELVDKTAKALKFWVDGGRAGKIGWACFVAKKPA